MNFNPGGDMGKVDEMENPAKTGRNDPCPCGSGRKWKRCCIPKPTAGPTAADKRRLMQRHDDLPPAGRTNFTPAAAEAAATGRKLPGLVVLPWTRVRLADSRDPQRGLDRFSLSGMRLLETEEIVAELARIGVEVDSQSFVEAAAQHRSAWTLSKVWTPTLKPVSRDFLGLAACELWRRFCPESPSLEMLDERMQAGYVALEAGQNKRACEIWLQFTDELLHRLPNVKSLIDADDVFPGLDSIQNWISEAEATLHNTSLKDQDVARAGLQWCRKLISRFPDQPTGNRRHLVAEQANFHWVLGERAEAEALLLQLIDDDPGDALGYCDLAELIGLRRDNPSADVNRAIKLLETALALPVRNAADYDLQIRLKELRERA